jgi:hypothetical protein
MPPISLRILILKTANKLKESTKLFAEQIYYPEKCGATDFGNCPEI